MFCVKSAQAIEKKRDELPRFGKRVKERAKERQAGSAEWPRLRAVCNECQKKGVGTEVCAKGENGAVSCWASEPGRAHPAECCTASGCGRVAAAGLIQNVRTKSDSKQLSEVTDLVQLSDLLRRYFLLKPENVSLLRNGEKLVKVTGPSPHVAKGP